MFDKEKIFIDHKNETVEKNYILNLEKGHYYIQCMEIEYFIHSVNNFLKKEKNIKKVFPEIILFFSTEHDGNFFDIIIPNSCYSDDNDDEELETTTGELIDEDLISNISLEIGSLLSGQTIKNIVSKGIESINLDLNNKTEILEKLNVLLPKEYLAEKEKYFLEKDVEPETKIQKRKPL